jgi:hypothetical protein
MPRTNKDVFLARLMRERDKFELLVNQVGFTRQLTLQGVSGKWSIKDILAHLLAYELYIADRMHEILHGETYSPCRTQNALDAFLDQFGYPDFGSPLLDNDTSDAWVIEKYKKVSLEDVVGQEIQAFDSIFTAPSFMPGATCRCCCWAAGPARPRHRSPNARCAPARCRPAARWCSSTNRATRCRTCGTRANC